ncbi:MAG: CHAT domain-containing tetratricopeptide repeat protein [Bacteroidia bacterium]|nr:CHAT domain-containing protein [Bacteroidia bacterium]MDW8159362.1 CHAT domain-containing tetratricopeptide repeat protein [Bacteroidia bacterium]
MILILLIINSLSAIAQKNISINCTADTLRINYLLNYAQKLEESQKVDSAAWCYDEAIKIWKAIKCGEENYLLAIRRQESVLKIKRLRALLLYSQNRAWLDSAIVFLKQEIIHGVRILGEPNGEVAQARHVLGTLHYYKGDIRSAVSEFEKALNQYKILFPSTDLVFLATYNNLGLAYHILGNYEKAVEMHTNSLKILAANGKEKQLNAAKSYNNLAIALQAQGKYSQALEMYLKALEIRLALLGNKHAQVGAIYHNLGLVYQLMGQYSKALEMYKQAIDIQITNYGTEHPEVAKMYNNMGALYFEEKKYAQAQEVYQKALSIYLSKGKDKVSIAKSYHNLGMVYKKQKQYEKAQEMYWQAIDIQRKELGENSADLVKSYTSLALLYEDLQKWDSALVMHKKAYEIQLSLVDKDDPILASTLNNMGIACYYNRNYKQALDYFDKALHLYFLPQDSDVINFSNPQKVNYTPITTDYSEILRTIQYQSNTLWALNRAEGVNSQLLMAIPNKIYWGKFLIERWRQEMLRETDRLRLGENSSSLFNLGISFSWYLDSLGINKKKSLQDAFVFCESNKAAALNLSLLENDAMNAAGIPDSIYQLLQETKKEITNCNQELEILAKPSTALDSLKKQVLSERKFSLSLRLDSLAHLLERNYSKYYELKYASFVANVDTLQKTVLKAYPQSALVEYFISLGDYHLYIFVITQKQFFVKKIFISPQEITENFKKLNRSFYIVQQNDQYDVARKKSFIQASTFFYQTLILPIEEFIKDKELIIVPDSFLWEIPFEILLKVPDKNAVQRIEKFSYQKLPFLNRYYKISYVPSATMLLRNYHLPPLPTHGLLAVAPVFDIQQKQELPLIYRNVANVNITYPEYVSSLPASEMEVKRIKQLFENNHQKATILLREQAKEEIFTSQNLKEYRYIHLATHGLFNRSNPSWSYILFSPPTQDSSFSSSKDGLLTAAECYNLNLGAELVTLSACETARGTIKPGEGLVGLTRGLFYSGARSVLVSQWKVPDLATSLLMQVFYKKLLQGKTKSQALHLAKEKLRRQFPHPYYWGAFILIGF